jgi:transposase
MQGRTPYQAELFSTVIIEDLIPANHILRKIDQAVSFSFVRDLTSELYSKETGRPSIDPEVFVRMLVVQYLFGIKSDRQLCEELQYNLAYRWFCQINLSDKVPHHSSMTRIRDRFGEEIFLKIFLEVLKICKLKGLIKGHEVMVDASLMKANAALDSLVPKGATIEEINNRPNFIRGKGYKNETYESFSDPDATLAGKTGVPKGLYYKVHNVVEPSHRIILDSHVTTGSSVDI